MAAAAWWIVSGAVALGLAAVALFPRQVVAHARAVLALIAVLTGAAALGIVELSPPGIRLAIDPSTEPLLPRDDPERDVYAEAVRDFGDDEIYTVAVVCGEVFRPPCLHALERAAERVARLDGVRSVASLLDATSYRWVEAQEWIEIAPFVDPVPDDEAELARLRARALADPVYRRTLVSDDAGAAALNVRFRKMDDKSFLASGLDAKIAGILAEEIRPPFRYHVAGRPHVKVHVYRGIVRDLLALVPLAALAMATVLALAFRSLHGVLLPLATALVAVVWTFGVIGWLGAPLSLLAGLLAPMLLAIGSVYGVYLVARYDEDAETAATPAEAALATLVHMRMPGLVAGVTTVIGFGSLLITNVPAVAELGVFAMFGVGSAMLVSLSGLPAVLALRPLSRAEEPLRRAEPSLRSESGPPRERWIESALASVAAFVARHANALLLAWLVAGVVALVAIPRIVIDTDYLSYFSPRDPVRRDFEEVDRWLAGVVPIYLVVDGAEPAALRDPALLAALERLQARVDAVPDVSRTLSVLDTLRKLNRAFARDDPEEERLPASREAVTELLFMLPKGESARLVTVDHARANLVVRTGVVGSSAIETLADGLAAEIAREPLPGGASVHVTGNAILLARSADGIARAQASSVGAAAATIAVLVSVALGSLRLGLIAMIPNVVPVLIFFGALGLGLAPLSLPTSLIGCMGLGMAIDDTVHLLTRFRAERVGGASSEQALRTTILRVGRPVAITTAMLCAGFLVITGSRFASLQAFGLLSATTMAICLACDLLLLPALLARLRL